ncbi:unnamed protein product, partial [Ectocarpus fasciculatus]
MVRRAERGLLAHPSDDTRRPGGWEGSHLCFEACVWWANVRSRVEGRPLRSGRPAGRPRLRLAPRKTEILPRAPSVPIVEELEEEGRENRERGSLTFVPAVKAGVMPAVKVFW